MSAVLIWLILAPICLALIAALIDKTVFRWALAGAGSLGYAVLVSMTVWYVWHQGPIYTTIGGWSVPWGIGLRVDDLSALFYLLLSLGLAGAMVFIGSTRGFNRGESPLLFLLAGAGAGILAAVDLFNLFVFVELAAVCTAALIALKGAGPERRRDSGAAGFLYLVLASASGMILLVSIMLIYAATGQLNMDEIAGRIHAMAPVPYAAAAAGVVAALGVKIGLVPLHFWQARAYAAAGSAQAAFLSGVAMKLYLYAMLRILWHPLAVAQQAPALISALLVMGAVNVLFGHIMALAQRDLRRLLAFSSVAHLGYILMGFGAGTRLGLVAAILHVVNHVMMKTALFWSGHVLCRQTRSADWRRFRGGAEAQPLIFAAFIVASLAIVGVPLTGGFASKWLVAIAAFERFGLWPVVVVAMGTIISAVYYARVIRMGLGRHSIQDQERSRATAPVTAPRLVVAAQVPPVLAAVACLAVGMGIRWVLPWVERAAGAFN